MTDQEKVKAYNEALEIARKYHKDCKGNTWVVECMENMFPELKESEDERMWKLIKKYVHCNISDMALNADHITREQLESWLEKQGDIDLEFFENGENEKREFVGYGFLKCKGDFLSFKEGETYWLEYIGKDNYNVRSDNLLGQTFHITPQQLYTVFRPTTWLEKQGEQKPLVIPKFKKGDFIRLKTNPDDIERVDSVWDDQYILDIKGECNHVLFTCQDLWEPVEEKPVEWSEEDKKMFDFAIKSIELCKQYAINNQVKGYNNLPDIPEKYQELIDWLKSLRFQPRQEWSREDKDMLYFIEEAIKGYYSKFGIQPKVLDWLKSLRPHSH